MAADILLIIPTFNHASTLKWAITSAQNQSVENIRIVVIGDGVGDDTRDVLAPLLSEDSRLHFLDKPKSVRHGEEYRHELISSSLEPIVGYLGDDDLLFRDHLELMVDTLAGRDFANPLPVVVLADGVLRVFDTDLADPESIAWHLGRRYWRNSVSLTGVVHTKESYERLPIGWRPAPPGRWSDHYMWQQYFSLPGFTAATATRASTAKFSASMRRDKSPEVREEEIRAFWLALQEPEFAQVWAQRMAEADINHYRHDRTWRLTAPLRFLRGHR